MESMLFPLAESSSLSALLDPSSGLSAAAFSDKEAASVTDSTSDGTSTFWFEPSWTGSILADVARVGSLGSIPFCSALVLFCWFKPSWYPVSILFSCSTLADSCSFEVSACSLDKATVSVACNSPSSVASNSSTDCSVPCGLTLDANGATTWILVFFSTASVVSLFSRPSLTTGSPADSFWLLANGSAVSILSRATCSPNAGSETAKFSMAAIIPETFSVDGLASIPSSALGGTTLSFAALTWGPSIALPNAILSWPCCPETTGSRNVSIFLTYQVAAEPSTAEASTLAANVAALNRLLFECVNSGSIKGALDLEEGEAAIYLNSLVSLLNAGEISLTDCGLVLLSACIIQSTVTKNSPLNAESVWSRIDFSGSDLFSFKSDILFLASSGSEPEIQRYSVAPNAYKSEDGSVLPPSRYCSGEP